VNDGGQSSYGDGDLSVVDEFIVLLCNTTNQEAQLMRAIKRGRLDQDWAAGLTNFVGIDGILWR
jgi:hypothetical protein